MKISAEILADSKSVRGERLTTFLLTFPRIILAEFNTHRAFSRNSSSSRAIPFAKMVESVEKNPFIPIAWQKSHKGMQGTEYLSDVPAGVSDKEFAIDMWLEARDAAVGNAKILNDTGVTKQLCNRLLEPFMWHTVICTSTDYDNFFNLRCPEYLISWYPSDRPEALEPTQAIFKSKKDAIARTEGECDGWTEEDWRECNISQAEIHIQALAEAMWDAMNNSTPKVLGVGEWHIPFNNSIYDSELEDQIIDKDPDLKYLWINPQPLYQQPDSSIDLTLDYMIYKKNLRVKIATARCARVSYTTVGSENKSSYKADIELYNKLVENGHKSPLEHSCQVASDDKYYYNIKGFKSLRCIVENE